MEQPFAFFTTESAITFRAAAGRIIPTDAGSPGADSDVALRLSDRALAARPERDRELFAAFLRAVEFLPVLRYGRGFSRLDPDRQAAVLRFLEGTRLLPRLRQGFYGLKAFVLLGYYGSDETWEALGYPGPRLDAPYYRLPEEG